MPILIDEQLDFLLFEKGEDISLNGIDKRALVLDYEDKTSYEDNKIIIAGFEIKTGDLIQYQNKNWIIVGQIDKNSVTYRSIITQCNFNIKFNFDGIIKPFPAIADGKTYSTDYSRYINLADGQILVTLQDNSDTSVISINQRFILERQADKITGIDKTKIGISILYCDLDSISPSDDLDNGVANIKGYTLNITNTTFNIKVGETLQVLTEFKNGDALITGHIVKYSVDNPSIVTITDSGLLTGLLSGNVNVNVWLEESPDMKNTKSFTIESLPIVPVYQITPNTTSMLQGDKVTYTCYKLVNGVDTATTWQIDNLTGSSVPSTGYYTYTLVSANSFSISNLKMYSSGKVKVRCTDLNNTDTTANYIETLITLKGGW